MNLKRLYREYRARREQFELLRLAATLQLDHAIKSQRIKTHSLPYRIKSFDSFAEKARRKNLTDPFNEIHDLVGLRVVCLFLSDLPKVGKVIEDTFHLIAKDNKIDERPKNVFGYMDIQYVVALEHTAVEAIRGMPFEIQVRTIAQDAWASVSHQLEYKQRRTIPKEWKRDFYALSALFYVADQHFRMLHQQSSGKLYMDGTV